MALWEVRGRWRTNFSDITRGHSGVTSITLKMETLFLASTPLLLGKDIPRSHKVVGSVYDSTASDQAILSRRQVMDAFDGSEV